MANPLTLRVPDNLRTFLQQEAERRGQSVAQIVIAACWQYLEEPRDAGLAQQVEQRKAPEASGSPNPLVAGSSPAPRSTIDSLRALVAGIDAKYEDAPMFEEPAHPICGFESYNDQDGETYQCCKPAHGSKVSHGNWRKV